LSTNLKVILWHYTSGFANQSDQIGQYFGNKTAFESSCDFLEKMKQPKIWKHFDETIFSFSSIKAISKDDLLYEFLGFKRGLIVDILDFQNEL
jgi:hypothetical protein